MIDRARLLQDLKKVVLQLEDDLRLRLDEDKPSRDKLHGEYEAARKAGRTAAAWETFRDDHVTQVAVAWVLATVFVRFVEDNGLIDEPWLGGQKLQIVKDRYTHWLRQHPQKSDRDYLLFVFGELGKLPGLKALLAEEGHSLVWSLGPTADGARVLREFWLGAGGDVVHDFADPEWGTRFLGDLYQDQSKHARKKYALVQTPKFIEDFLLDKTLEPALAEFGLKETRIIDPACGSGHFLLGSFARMFARLQKAEPAEKAQVLAQRALDAVAGVDLNPFAVAIARFRLLVAALKVCGVRRLRDAFDFRVMVASGDSLLHGRHQGARQRMLGMDLGDEFDFEHFFVSEDKELLHAIFGRSYHAVVGNPPYIRARDRALNDLYRQRWPEVCHGKYQLGVPFTQLFFELARPKMDDRRAPGFVGMITGNQFMKAEFGKRVIEDYLARSVEVTGVIDMSGVQLPDYGTVTVILLGRPRSPVSSTVRAVLGIRGEPSPPEDPGAGQVWPAIVTLFDQPESASEFASCSDMPREVFAKHPWPTGGGGAADLKDQLDGATDEKISDFVESIGFASFTGTDEVFVLDRATLMRQRTPSSLVRRFVHGKIVRDWSIGEDYAFVPYDSANGPVPHDPQADWARRIWPFRTTVGGVKSFGGRTRLENGDAWWTWYRWVPEKYRTHLSITFAFVASHNHFVLDRGGKAFNRTAPIIKLPPGATEDDHLGLLGLLNCSVVGFYLQQICKNKGGPGGGSSKDEKWHDFYEHNAANVMAVPVPDGRPLWLARQLDGLAQELQRHVPTSVVASRPISREELDAARGSVERLRSRMLSAQEELDWDCYRLYGLVDQDLVYRDGEAPALRLGERAFEILLAREVSAGTVKTKWFEKLGATPTLEVPERWPAAYRQMVQRRMDLISTSRDLALIERMQCKRRWEMDPWEKQEAAAMRSWLLDRMEQARFWLDRKLTTTARFAELLRNDAHFVHVANLYRGRDDHDFDALVRELVTDQGVPFLPVQRYKPPGLRKRLELWERTWELQRHQDAGEDVRVDVPEEYKEKDFQSDVWWKLRGKLDVPMERFVLYPAAEANDDPTPVFTWAGFDHLEQAKALAAWLIDRKEQDGWAADKLKPLYAGLDQLIPWLKQWHNDVDPETQQRLGDYFKGFLDQELRAQGLTIDDVRNWAPPARGRGRRGRAAATATPADDEEPDS